MPMFTCSSDASHFIKSQRLIALAAVVAALNDKENTSSREDDARYAAVGEIRELLGVR